MENIELWKDIPDYEGLYQVSNLGRVKSLERKGTYDRILKPFLRGKYYSIDLFKEGKRKYFTVHKLVALVFIPNPQNLPQVNHKDENKENNHVSNLEWVTPKENINYGTRNERVSKKLKIKNKGKISPIRKPILQFTLEGEFIREWDSATTASKELNINQGGICWCCKGNKKSESGYIWRYK